MQREDKKYFLPISELIDRLTIVQIKLVLDSKNRNDYLDELLLLKHDIKLELETSNSELGIDLIQTIVSLAQMNLHIWYLKDKMKNQLNLPTEYSENLKLAHQLNGLRNQLKNSLLRLSENKNVAKIRSNTDLDGLEIDLGLDVN